MITLFLFFAVAIIMLIIGALLPGIPPVVVLIIAVVVIGIIYLFVSGWLDQFKNRK